MTGKALIFPNGHRTTSDRLSQIKVLPCLSASLTQPYVEIFETGHCVYQGLVDLNEVEVTDSGLGITRREKEPQS